MAIEDKTGHLRRGFIVFEGGQSLNALSSESELDAWNFANGQEGKFVFAERPAAKSSTNAAMGASACQTCGCKVGEKTQRLGCKCHCH